MDKKYSRETLCISTGKQALQIVGHAGIAGLAHTLVIVDIVCHVTSS